MFRVSWLGFVKVMEGSQTPNSGWGSGIIDDRCACLKLSAFDVFGSLRKNSSNVGTFNGRKMAAWRVGSVPKH